jgi:hypothetical protein
LGLRAAFNAADVGPGIEDNKRDSDQLQLDAFDTGQEADIVGDSKGHD